MGTIRAAKLPHIHQNRSVFEASMKLCICTGVNPPRWSWKNTPNIFAPPGGRHLAIQYGCHFGPIFSYDSKTKTGRNILFVAKPPFYGSRNPTGPTRCRCDGRHIEFQDGRHINLYLSLFVATPHFRGQGIPQDSLTPGPTRCRCDGRHFEFQDGRHINLYLSTFPLSRCLWPVHTWCLHFKCDWK